MKDLYTIQSHLLFEVSPKSSYPKLIQHGNDRDHLAALKARMETNAPKSRFFLETHTWSYTLERTHEQAE